MTELTQFHIDEPTAMTLGKFDGLHRGHDLLVRTLLRECEKCGYAPAAFTFADPPKAVIEQTKIPQLLTNRQRAKRFAEMGIAYLLQCPFTEEVRTLSPEAFVRRLCEDFSVRLFVVGEDFRFGRGRAGDTAFLLAHEADFSYRTAVLPKLLDEDSGREISSTFIREEIAFGHIEKANEMLGYPYFLEGTVVEGEHVGHSIGFPTANLLPEEGKLLPPLGVYASVVLLDGMEYEAVTDIGKKPTVSDKEIVCVESFLLHGGGDLYGKRMKVQLMHYLRPEIRFSSLENLRKQITKDIANAEGCLKNRYKNVTNHP